MKNARKVLLLVLCLVLVVSATVMGTLAYLTSTTDAVVNTFTVGNVQITLDETDVDNSTPDADRDTANSYKLIPGESYTKDPIVHVADTSEDCYLFVKVENEITAIEADTTVAGQMAAKGWVAVQGAPNVYVYTTNNAPAVVNGGANVTVFKTFTVSGNVTNEALATYADKTIKVTAYAIQSAGMDGMTAAQIWSTGSFN